MKLLVIALSGIGDALMFTPSLVKLREAMPNSRIDILVMFKGVKDIYEKLPQVNTIHFFEFLNSSKLRSLAFVLSLRNQYDATINVYPSNRVEYNLISRLINAKKRVSVEYLREDKKNLGFLNNIRIKENDDLHNVEENYKMVEYLLDEKYEKIPPLQFKLEKFDLEYAKDFLIEKRIGDSEIVIGFHPGCNTLKNHEKRRWEPEKFALLANKLIEQYHARILLFGGAEENHLKEKIISNSDSRKVTAVQTFNLAHTAAVMKRCNVFITNDSSLMHVPAALELNVVAIIGPTNRNYIHPWQTDYKIASLNLDCSPCFFYSPKPLTCIRTDLQFKCIKDLSVEDVFGKAKEFLDNK